MGRVIKGNGSVWDQVGDRLLEATDPFGTRIGWVLSRHMAETDPFGTRIGWVLSRHTAETDPFGTRLGRVVKGNGSVWDQDRTGSPAGTHD